MDDLFESQGYDRTSIDIISDGEFRKNLLVGCRNDAAIVLVLGNINSNKVQGHIDLPLEIIF